MYQRQSATVYPEVARLLASDAFEGDHLSGLWLGADIDIDGRKVVASARQAAYIFQLPATLKDAELIQDDFQDGNAAGWSPSQPSWAVVTAGDSRAYQQRDLTALGVRSIFSNVVGANQAVEVQAKPTAFSAPGRGIGVIARYADPSNYYELSIRNSNRLILQRRQNGAFTEIDAASFSVELNRIYRLRIEAIGSRIRGYVNGELLVEARDRALRRGSPGLTTSGARADFDNVVVTPSPLTSLFIDDFEGQFVHENWQIDSGVWRHVFDGSLPWSENRSHYAQTLTRGGARVLGGVDTRDQVIEADAFAPAALTSDAWYGVMARYSGAGNFYYLRVGHGGRVSLRKQVNGSVFELDSALLVQQPGVRYNLRLEALGSVLRGYVNGRLLLEARDQSHRIGKYGLGTFATAAGFDNVHVTQP